MKCYFNLILVILACSMVTTSAFADNHALIMGIGTYARGTTLRGNSLDIDNAQKIARMLNVPAGNITIHRDDSLTLNGFRQALEDFGHKIKPGDRVFIYFSGHGSSYSRKDGQCEQAIVTQEMKRITKAEFHNRLHPIIDKAVKTFVFLDTCFSGGIIESSKGMARSEFDDDGPQAKFYTDVHDDPCEKPTNMAKSTRDFGIESAKEIPNYYLLAAAAPSEAAVDGGPILGSFATSSFYQCMKSGVVADKDGDGVVTLAELRACAQQRTDNFIHDGRTSKPNFQFIAQTLTEGNGPGGNTPIAFGAEAGAPNTLVDSLPENHSSPINSMAFLNTLAQGRDAKRSVIVVPSKHEYKIGNDFLEMTVTSDKAGYLSIFSVGSSGKIFQLFPNKLDQNSYIDANTPVLLPRPEWRIRANGPVGTDRFLVVVSNTSDRFANLGTAAGPYSEIANTTTGVKNVVLSLLAPQGNCDHANRDRLRDFEAEADPCSTAYGAAMVDVKEVN